MRYSIAILSALLCAAMLAGCSSAASGAAAGSSSVSSAAAPASSLAVSSAASSEAASSTASSAVAVAYTQTELQDVLDGCKNFEPDTAGGSLKGMAAAANLVEFSSKYVTVENSVTVATDCKTWYDALSEDDKAALANNWDIIYDNAEKIVTDPASVADQLDEAGIKTDFSNMDTENGMTLISCITSLVKHSW